MGVRGGPCFVCVRRLSFHLARGTHRLLPGTGAGRMYRFGDTGGAVSAAGVSTGRCGEERCACGAQD